jgi:hypothetical protein
VSLSNDGRYPTLELTPQQRRQKTLEALTTQIAAVSRSKPVLMIFEDVHWIDPTSLEMLGPTEAAFSLWSRDDGDAECRTRTQKCRRKLSL